MPNPGDFDLANAVRQQRAEEQRVQAQQDLFRANILKLLRYADEQVEEIRNAIVSEFVFTEKWSTTEQISDKRAPEAFKRELRAGQQIISTEDGGSIFRPRTIYTVATGHERQTRYYGSWLALNSTSGVSNYRSGLVKLRQPRTGYAYVQTGGWDPRNVGRIEGIPQIYESLEEATEDISPRIGFYFSHVEQLTKPIRQALDFATTGQPPTPKHIEPGHDGF